MLNESLNSMTNIKDHGDTFSRINRNEINVCFAT